MLGPKEWHNRFRIQASWTSSVQHYLIDQISNLNQVKAIEIGCGTGAILHNLSNSFSKLYGLDINFSYLSFSKSHLNSPQLICGDGYKLPISSNTFGVAVCHYLLLWITDPVVLLNEIYRVLEINGSLLIFAEPDYGGRIDYSPNLEELGRAQIESLKDQGADPMVGRKLRNYLTAADFSEIKLGVLGNEWNPNFERDNWESEWEMFAYDLKDNFTSSELASLKQKDLKAYEEQARVLYVPTFFASAKKLDNKR